VFARAILAGDDQTRALVLEAAADCLGVVESILADGAQAGELRSDLALDGLGRHVHQPREPDAGPELVEGLAGARGDARAGREAVRPRRARRMIIPPG
jgi:hypothetical protein